MILIRSDGKRFSITPSAEIREHCDGPACSLWPGLLCECQPEERARRLGELGERVGVKLYDIQDANQDPY